MSAETAPRRKSWKNRARDGRCAPFMRRAREGKRVSLEELWPTFPMHFRRRESRNRSQSAAVANGGRGSPAASSRSKAARASAFAASRNKRVPPMICPPAWCRRASSRAMSLPRRARHLSQSELASARSPIAIAGPLTGHGPRAARKCGTMSGDARRETKPKPSQSVGLAERAQDDSAARRQRCREAFPLAIEIGEGLVDDQHAPAREALMQVEQAARVVIRPSGLFGLTTIATSRPFMSSSRFALMMRAPGGEGRRETAIESAPARRPRRAAICETGRG